MITFNNYFLLLLDVGQALITSCTTSSTMKNMIGLKKEIDTIWIGSSSISTRYGNKFNEIGLLSQSKQVKSELDDNYNDEIYGNNDGDDDEDNNYDGTNGFDLEMNFESNSLIESKVESVGLEIALKGGLLEANRKVEKISIGYLFYLNLLFFLIFLFFSFF